MKKLIRLFTLFVICAVFFTGCSPSETEITSTTSSVKTPTPTPPTPTPIPEGEIFTVTNTLDSDVGSLWWAMKKAKKYDTITFNPAVFPPDAPATISVTSEELPHIRVSYLALDASNAGVIIDGSEVPGDWIAGLQIVSSSGNKIMGLQISNFPGPGITISGDAKNNIIGGDRGLGDGPFGQGNQIILNELGIGLTSDTEFNTITGNIIGAKGLSNHGSGISFDEGAHGNIIGPNNIIAFNEGIGIADFSWDALQNTITQNSIYNSDYSVA